MQTTRSIDVKKHSVKKTNNQNRKAKNKYRPHDLNIDWRQMCLRCEDRLEMLKMPEQKILTKWDVAKIVFIILAALSGIIGIIFGILHYLKNP